MNVHRITIGSRRIPAWRLGPIIVRLRPFKVATVTAMLRRYKFLWVTAKR